MEAYPLSQNSPYKKVAWRFAAMVAIYYIVNILIVIFWIPPFPVKMSKFQTTYYYLYYIGLLLLIVFLFIIPQKLSRAAFLQTASIYVLFSAPIFYLGELIILFLKTDADYNYLKQNLAHHFASTSYLYFMQLMFFLLTLGLRKLVNYIIDLKKK